MRRVVVSGMGAVTPLGGDLESTWKNLIANKSGANFISKFDTTDFQTKISCEVPIKNDDELKINNWIDFKIFVKKFFVDYYEG